MHIATQPSMKRSKLLARGVAAASIEKEANRGSHTKILAFIHTNSVWKHGTQKVLPHLEIGLFMSVFFFAITIILCFSSPERVRLGTELACSGAAI